MHNLINKKFVFILLFIYIMLKIWELYYVYNFLTNHQNPLNNQGIWLVNAKKIHLLKKTIYEEIKHVIYFINNNSVESKDEKWNVIKDESWNPKKDLDESKKDEFKKIMEIESKKEFPPIEFEMNEYFREKVRLVDMEVLISLWLV